jgi:hypothetical protein
MSAQVYYRFWDLLGCTPSAIVPVAFPTPSAGAIRKTSSRNQMRRFSSHWNGLGKPWHLSYLWIAERPQMRAALVCLSCSTVVWGVRVSPHRALDAPSPRCTWRRPRYAQKNLVRACASSPEISRGGYGILPSRLPSPTSTSTPGN